MPRPPENTARRPAEPAHAGLRTRPQQIEALLRDLGPQLRRGEPAREPPGCFATGIAAIDQLLGGGFPRGRLSEICGPPSSGRTSLALALLARTTGAGEVCAVVDAADGFDPPAAQAAGVTLERVLWARTPGLSEALRAAERVLETGGFALVLLCLPARARPPSAVSCTRLARAALGAGAALVLLSFQRSTGTAAELALEMQAARAHFTGTPKLLEEVEAEARLVRHRSAPTCGRARFRVTAA